MQTSKITKLNDLQSMGGKILRERYVRSPSDGRHTNTALAAKPGLVWVRGHAGGLGMVQPTRARVRCLRGLACPPQRGGGTVAGGSGSAPGGGGVPGGGGT
jgi:hypothetical protein